MIKCSFCSKRGGLGLKYPRGSVSSPHKNVWLFLFLRFSPDPLTSSVLPSLKASLDLSAEYLILTDVQRKVGRRSQLFVCFCLHLCLRCRRPSIVLQVLYVMELRQDLEKGKASFTAVSEFLLTHPVLSFGVRDVTHTRLRHTEVLPAEEESESLSAGARRDAQKPTCCLYRVVGGARTFELGLGQNSEREASRSDA